MNIAQVLAIGLACAFISGAVTFFIGTWWSDRYLRAWRRRGPDRHEPIPPGPPPWNRGR